VTAGWRAFNISSDKTTGVGDWRDDDLVSYLSIGHAAGRGTASGPMGEAVDDSLSQLTGEDIRAVVTYLRSLPAIAFDRPAGDTGAASACFAKEGGGTPDPRGKMVFEGACVSLPRMDRRKCDFRPSPPSPARGRSTIPVRPMSPKS